MKKINLLLLLLICHTVIGQKKDVAKRIKKNEISVEFYKPIENPLPEFYNFNYGLGNTTPGVNNYNRNGFSNAFGISYERVCKDNIIFRTRIGLALIRDNVNQISQDLSVNPINNYSITYTYKQNHLNIFVGLAKRIELIKKLTLDLGVDVASIYYSKGKGNFNDILTQTDLTTGDIDKSVSIVNSEMGNVFSFGVGPYLKPEIEVFKNFTLSLEMQVYFLRTISNGTSYQLETFDTYHNDIITNHLESPTTVNNNLKIWEWTKVSPLLRFGYKF